MNDSFLTALTALFKKYSKKQLATMSFVEFTTIIESNLNAKGLIYQRQLGLKVDDKFYSLEMLEIIHNDIRLQSSFIRRILFKQYLKNYSR